MRRLAARSRSRHVWVGAGPRQLHTISIVGARRILVVAVVLALVAPPASARSITAVDTIAESAEPLLPAVRGKAVIVTPPNPPGSPGATLVIGDSAIAGLRWVVGARSALRGTNFTLDLESCRRLIGMSCLGREGRRPETALEALTAQGRGFHTLIVATGYNDWAANFALAFDQIVAESRRLGIERIVWMTYRVDVSYVSPNDAGNDGTFRSNNTILAERLATGAYPDVFVADFNTYTRSRSEWFVADGLHYRQLGAWGTADYVTRKMAFLDHRSCPFPFAPGEVAASPCPDPDTTGPPADLAQLFSVSNANLLCYEIGDDRHVECAADSHPGA
jgi:hypothetical protein